MNRGDSAESRRKLAELAGRLAELGTRAQEAVRGARQALATEPSSKPNASMESTEEAREATSARRGAQVEVAVK